MTEKRFTTDNGSHEDVCLVDNLTKKEYESNFEDMVSLMNDIWNQTQRFEKHNQRLEKENEQLKVRLNDLNDENEWLKSEIQKLYNFVKIDVEHNIEVYPKSLMEHILEILKIIGDVE